MKYGLLLLLLVAGVGLSTVLPAQTILLDKVGVQEGLSQGFITCITQDQEGFVWAGTLNGLNRYDGVNVKVFGNNPLDTLNLVGTFITGIVDVGECLLVSTINNGLNVFLKKSQRFIRLPFLSPQQSTDFQKGIFRDSVLPAGSIAERVLVDETGAIWMLASNNIWWGESGWITRLVVPDGFWGKLADQPELLSQIAVQAWWMDNFESKYPHYLNLVEGVVIVTTRTKTYSFISKKQQWQPWQPPVGMDKRLINMVDTYDQGMIIQDIDTVTVYRSQQGGDQKLDGVHGIVMHVDKELIWMRQGEYIKAYANDIRATVDFTKAVIEIPIADSRTVFHVDRSGNLWFTEKADGLIRYSPSLRHFKHYFKGKSIMQPVLMTPAGGLSYIHNYKEFCFEGKVDKALAKLADYMLTHQLLGAKVNDDGKGKYWVVVSYTPDSRPYLLSIDQATLMLEIFEIPIASGLVFYSTFDKKGNLWFALNGELVRYNTTLSESTGQRWQSYDFSSFLSAADVVEYMVETNDGSWWLATQNGLILGKPTYKNKIGGGTELSYIFQSYKVNPGKRNSLLSNNIAALLVSPNDDNLLWIATKGGGLSCLNIKEEIFVNLTTQEGLPDNVIYGILADKNGYLWLSSNRGLIRYLPATGEIRQFSKKDGLQEYEFNSHSFGVAFNGELMFGGVNGLNVFDPNEITDNPNRPSVMITGLYVNNQLVEAGDTCGILPLAVEFTEQITLPFSKNNIRLSFAALEYTASAKNRYRYYLAGAEHKWEHEGTIPSAVYLNLEAGNYTFIVEGSNNDGVWSGKPAQLKIRILPPWYQHPLAYSIYVLLFLSLGYWYWNTQNQRQQLEYRLALEKQQSTQRLAQEQKEVEYLKQMNRLRLDEITQHLLDKARLLETIQETRDEEKASSPDTLSEKAELRNASILTSEDWDDFSRRFENVYPGFLDRIAQYIPTLTPAEIRLLVLMKMELNTSEAASILGISAAGVKKTRYRLRKKLEEYDVSVEQLMNI